MSNMDLWASLEKTDPKYTKPFNRGGFKGTATNGTYIARKLTEVFGPCGKGWRFVVEAERVDEGHTLKNGDKAKVHVIRGHLAYMLDGVWYQTSPQFGQTMLVDENKYGTFTDEEAPKKSVTDAVSKCAVLLGVAADIHLGLFDDSKYVNDRRAEEAEKTKPVRAPQKPVQHPAEPKADVFGLEPVKAVSIPVPNLGPDMKAAWTKWCNEFRLRVSLATGDEMDGWLRQNAPQLEGLKAFNDKWHAKMMADVDEFRRKLDAEVEMMEREAAE